MARTLTGSATASKNAVTSSPRIVVKVAWPSPVGDKYYAEQALAVPITAEGRITKTGPLDALLQADNAQAVNVVSDFWFELSDVTGTIRGYIEQVQTEHIEVNVYQHFVGNLEADLVLLMKGMINTPVQRDPATAAIRFDVTDVVSTFDEEIGTLASVDAFPEVDPDDEGKMLPIVYGYNKKVRGVAAVRSPHSTLLYDIGADDMSFTVVDGARFPQGSSIILRVGQEEVSGTFSGNIFTVTERPRVKYLGKTTQYTGTSRQLRDMWLPGNVDNLYKGYLLEVSLLKGETIVIFSARIAATESEYGIVKLAEDLRGWNGDTELFESKPLPKGTTFSITTPRLEHRSGEIIEQVREFPFVEAVFVVNDAPSAAVCDIWMPGTISTGATFGDRVVEETKETVVYIPRSDYSVNLDDDQFAADIEHNVTTVTFRVPFGAIATDASEHAILADVRGTDRGAGMLEDPDDIINDILVELMSQIAAENVDATSFAAAGAQIEHLDMSFSFTSPRSGLALCADLAFQARCALVWEGGKAHLRYLENAPAASSVATVGQDEAVLMSPELYHSDYSRLVTEVVARYTEEGEEKRAVARDDDAFTTYGRRTREIDLWAYDAEGYAQEIAGFWVKRWAMVYERIRLTTFLETLELERLDTVTLDLGSDLVHAGQQGIVERVTQQPGNPLVNLMDEITVDLWLPRGPGCGSGTCEVCETSCETGTENCVTESCGDACQTTCQPFGCGNVTEAAESGGGGVCLDQAMVWCLSATQSDTSTPPSSDECADCVTTESASCTYDRGETGCPETGDETTGKCYPWTESITGDSDAIACQTTGTQTEDPGCVGCENNQTSDNDIVVASDPILNCGERKPTRVTDDILFGDLNDVWLITSESVLQLRLNDDPYPSLEYDGDNRLGVKIKAGGGINLDAGGLSVDIKDWSDWPGAADDFSYSDSLWHITWSNLVVSEDGSLAYDGGWYVAYEASMDIGASLEWVTGCLGLRLDDGQPFHVDAGLHIRMGHGLEIAGDPPTLIAHVDGVTIDVTGAGELEVIAGYTENAEQTAEADLNQAISDPPDQIEVQMISNKVDAILAKLRLADIIAT